MSTPGTPSFWAAVMLVARREIVERARERSFLISTAFTLLMLIGIVAIPPLLGFGDPPTYRVAFVDAAAQSYAPPAAGLADQLDVELEQSTPTLAQGQEQLAADELDALVTGEGIHVREELDPRLDAVLQGASRQVRGSAALEDAGLTADQVAAVQTVAPLPIERTEQVDPEADTRQGIAFVGTFVLYGQLLGYGFWVALGVVEEKSTRVVEVLLATVRPRALLAGKILGIGLLGLAQLLVLAVVGLTVAQLIGTVSLGAEAVLPVALVFGWFVLGFAFYASLFAAAAARVSRQEDLQSVTTPATLLVMVSFFAAFAANGNPDSVAARVLAVLPPFSALVNPVRTAAGNVALWEVGLALVLMVLAVVVLVTAAARLYEGAILRMGATVSMREAWRSRSNRP